MADRFKWLGRSTVTRSKDGSAGFPLETGHIYDCSRFDALVIDEWVITGNAEFVKVEAKDTVLDVQSPTVKTKVPKLGAKL